MEQEQERIVKGIWIPIGIWKDTNLTWNEKILLLEIDSFTSQEKDCYFSDEYISELLNISTTNANKTLASLIKKGYVIKTKFDGRRRYVKSALSQTTDLPCQERQTSRACANNTNNNSSLINKDNKEEKEDKSSSKKGKVVLDMSIVATEFLPVVVEWLEYKKEKNQSYKPKGFVKFYNKLVEMSKGNVEIARQIIDQSMQNNYSGIFPLRQNNYGQQSLPLGMIITESAEERNKKYEESKGW